VKSAGQGWLLDVTGVDDVGMLDVEDGDVNVDGALLLALRSADDVRTLASAEVGTSPLDELVHAHSNISPAADRPARTRRGCAIITAPH
jgi:hypothetical protein